jgi:hypothetical protein
MRKAKIGFNDGPLDTGAAFFIKEQNHDSCRPSWRKALAPEIEVQNAGQ